MSFPHVNREENLPAHVSIKLIFFFSNNVSIKLASCDNIYAAWMSNVAP